MKMGENSRALIAFNESMDVLNSIKDKVPVEYYTEQLKYVNEKIEGLK